MNAASSLARRRPLVTFFVLAYALSWWPFPMYVADVWPIPFFAFGSLLAALIVIPLSEGGAGLRALAGRMLRWRVGWRWYAVALGLPPAVVAVAVALNVALGAPAPSLGEQGPWYALILVFAVRLINPLDGPMGDEPGWRGYAQPRLQAARSPLVATVILGLLVAGHRPKKPLFGLASCR